MSLLVVPSARWSIRLSVAHWGVDAATLGPSDDGRLLLHVGKQQSGRRNLSGYRRRLRGKAWPRPRSGATGEVFSSRPFMVSRSRCPYSVTTGYP